MRSHRSHRLRPGVLALCALAFASTAAGQTPVFQFRGDDAGDSFGRWVALVGDGRASASFNLPPGADPGLAGVQLHHAYLVASGFGVVDLASNAVPLTLLD